MDSDTSWYDEGQNHFKTQPSTSGSQRGRPPDGEMKEEKPSIIIMEEVSLVDDEDDPEEALNSFHNFTRKNILLSLTGVEIHEELQFLEALKQFKMILEEKVEVLTLRINLKEMLYKYLLFFATNYRRIAIIYKDQYLDVMEDILLFYCDVIREFFRDQKRRNEKMKVIQEARRIKILLRDCLFRKIDRILHVLLKVRLAPEIEEYGRLWGDVYMYFLTKVPYKHTDDDILRGFIAFQKFKTIRVKSESPMIDKLMLQIYKKTTEELRRIPCLGEIMVRMKRDRLYTVRDMVTRYMRYFKEKRSRTENFEMEDFDEDTVDVNVKEMRRLDLSGSSPPVQSSFNSSSPTARLFVERRKGVRKTVLDMAEEPSPQFEQYNTDFSLFDDDNVAKRETPEEETVVVLDDEDDDVIVVCDNLRSVITIDDDDDEEPLHIEPPPSPPPREALSPDRVLRPPDTQPPINITSLKDNQPPHVAEHIETSPPENPATSQGSLVNEPERESFLPSANVENSVPEKMLPKEATIPKNTSLPVEKLDDLAPAKVPAQLSTRLVKEVDNSLMITINARPYRKSPVLMGVKEVPEVILKKPEDNPPEESLKLLAEKSTSPRESTETKLVVECDDNMDIAHNLEESLKHSLETSNFVSKEAMREIEKTVSSKEAEILLAKATCPPPNFEKEHLSSAQGNVDLNTSESLTPETSSEAPCLDDLPLQKSTEKPENQQVDKLESPKELLPQPMEIKESGLSKVPDQLGLEEKEKPPLKIDVSGSRNESHGNNGGDQMNEGIMEVDPPSLKTTFESLGNVVNSTMNEESGPSINTTSISPISKPVFANVDSRIKSSITKQLGVLPSSKIPSDLEDSPDNSPNKNTDHLINISDTSNISSPLFECIDKVEAKNYFDRQKMVVRVSSSSDEPETSLSTTTATTTTTGSSISENITVSTSASSNAESSESQLNLQLSDISSAEDGNSTMDNTVIQVDNTGKDSDVQAEKDLGEPDESQALEKGQGMTSEVIEKKTLKPKTHHQAQTTLSTPRNYSNLTECFTKFTEELSVEDMSQSEELTSSAQNTALPTIDLVSSTENANDVIIVKCRPIEPLKDEENIVSGPETITFSTDDVLTPSDEHIALIVTYPGSSQEESQHFLISDGNFALANDEQLTFDSDEGAPGSDVSLDQQSDFISMDSNQKTSIDDLSLSGSQPYTPHSSPGTRIEALKTDIGASSTIVEPILGHVKAADHQNFDSQCPEAAVIKVTDEKRSLKVPIPLEKVSKVINNVAKRRKSTDKASKPRRTSSELSKVETSKKTDKSVEDFRDDLSQSVSTIKRITPQEVDKINKLPLKYSQPIEGPDASQHLTEVSQTNLPDKQPVLPEASQVQTVASQLISKGSKLDVGTGSSSDKKINNLTRSASFVEEKLHELYIKEYGNGVPQSSSAQRILSRRGGYQEATPIRSLKMYAKDKSMKEVDRDLSLKSYKALIKDVSKRRSSVLRDVGSTLPKEDKMPNRVTKASEDIPQQKDLSDVGKGALSQEVNMYDHSEFFNNGIEGPIGKPLGGTDVENNFFWDIDNDANKEDAFSGTISVKPDHQLFQGKKGGGVAPQKGLVSRQKSVKPKGENSPTNQKSPEKNKITLANMPQSELYAETELNSVQEKQPNYFDYSFNSFFSSQTSIKIPLQQNLTSPEISSSYYPNLNYTNQSPICFNANKLPSQTGLFLPNENLEIDPNLLHSEKNILENFSEEFAASSEDTSNLLDQHYSFETSEEVPYLSLSNALIGGSVYSASQQSSIMFKDNPFIGQNVDNIRSFTSPSYVPEVEQIASLVPSQAHSGQTTNLVPAPVKAKIVPAIANPYTTQNQGNGTSTPEPVQSPAQIYSDPGLNLHNNLYYDQRSLRLPDISTLKDPRRKNNENFAQAHEMTGSNVPQSNFMSNVSPTVAHGNSTGYSIVNNQVAQNSEMLQPYEGTPVQNGSIYKSDVEQLPRIATSTPLPSKIVLDSFQTTTITQKNKTLHAPKVEESSPTETLQESLQKAQLPPKKRKLTEDEELAIYIQKFKEEKERKKKLEENISYPAQRQMSIADLQRDFPKVKTLAARKLYPEETGYPDQNYYDYPQGYEQYGDFNDYGNKRSIMNVYINGVRECSANYPLCLMIGTVHTCVNNQANNTPENNSNKPEHSDNASQPRLPAEVPQYPEITAPVQNYQNIQKNLMPDVIPRQVVDVPAVRPKRSRKAGVLAGEAPPAKRGKSRELPVHRNGHKVAEKRKNRDFEPEAEPHRKKIALSTDIEMEKKSKNHTPNGKIIGPKLKSIMKPVKVSLPESSKNFAIEENATLEAAPSSPVKKTKSGRVCKKPRPDYDDVIKSHFNGASKVKKTVKFKL